MNPTFRFATLEDLEKIVAIYNQTIPTRMATADLEPISVESRYDWFDQHMPNDYPLWIIEVNHCVAGWVSLSPFKERAAYKPTAEISIYIDQEFKGQKLGHQALLYVESKLSDYSFETIVALIFGHNIPSQKLFTKNGYEKWGHLPQVAQLDHEHRDLLFFGKRYQ